MKKLILNMYMLLMVALLSECTINKRHYREGFQVTWNINKTTNKNQLKKESIKPFDVIELNHLSDSENEEVLYASTQKIITPLTKPRFVNTTRLNPDSCGDIIVMVNGDEISAKVIEVNQRTIKYKSCENLGGPLFVLSKEKMFMIRYANGTKEVFPKEVAQPGENKNNSGKKKSTVKTGAGSEKKINPMALASLICVGAFFLYFPLVLAPIFALIACFQFNKHPDKYKAKGMVIPALIIGAIIITVLIILLIGIA